LKLNRIFVILAGVLGLVGVIVEVGFDLDNVYDMTTTTLFVLILIFALLGAFLGGKPDASMTQSAKTKPNDQK